jgi:hypothetical protein
MTATKKGYKGKVLIAIEEITDYRLSLSYGSPRPQLLCWLEKFTNIVSARVILIEDYR